MIPQAGVSAWFRALEDAHVVAAVGSVARAEVVGVIGGLARSLAPTIGLMEAMVTSVVGECIGWLDGVRCCVCASLEGTAGLWEVLFRGRTVAGTVCRHDMDFDCLFVPY